MKKSALFAALFALTAFVHAEDVAGHKGVTAVAPVASETSALWNEYNSLKSSAKSDLNSLEEDTYGGLTPSAAVDKLIRLAEIGTALGRNDIAGWYYNNAAFAWISLFKSKTAWEGTNLLIGKETIKKDRKAKVVAMQKDALLYVDYLQNASALLDKAEATGFGDASFKDKVASNRGFIKWVTEFSAKKL